MISLATAHPAKFPETIEAAIGVRPPMPSRILDIMERPERFTVMENDLGAIKSFIRTHGKK